MLDLARFEKALLYNNSSEAKMNLKVFKRMSTLVQKHKLSTIMSQNVKIEQRRLTKSMAAS